MKSRTLSFKLTSLTLTLTTLLMTFAASVSATPAPNPLKEPEPPWPDDYVLDVLPGWAQQPPPPEPVRQAMPQPSVVERAVVENQMFARATTNVVGPNAPVGPNDIGASTVNSVTPNLLPTGSAFDLCFNVTVSSPDLEYLDRFDVDLPDGWTVNSVTPVPGNTFCGYGSNQGTAAGNVVYWQTNGYPSGCGEWDVGTYDFCANVTLPDCTGTPWSLPWNIIGDGYGGTPHSVSGSIGADCLQDNIYLTPNTLQVLGCAAISQTHTLDLWNNTGVSTTFTITYDVSGNASISGTTSLYITNTETVSFSVELTPDACQYGGTQVTATVHAAGGGYSDTTYITKTITSDFGAWQNEPIAGALSIQWGMGAVGVNPAATGDVGYYVGGLDSGGALRPDLQMYDPDTATWTQLTDMPNPRHSSVAGWIGGLLYVAGGMDAGFAATDDLQVYNPATGTWDNTTPANLPTALGGGNGGVGTCSSGTGECLFHVGGGPDSSFANSVTSTYQYSPTINTWTQLDDKPAGSSPDGHLIGTGVGCMGYIFVGGDYRGYHDFFRLDATQSPGSQWFTAANIPANAGAMSPALVCKEELESLFLIGGDPVGGWSGTYNDTVYQYHIPSNTWSGPLPQVLNVAQTGSVALHMHNRLWTFGGTVGSSAIEPVPHESMEQCPVCTEIGWLEGYVMDSETGDVDPTCTDAVVHVEPGNLDVPVDPSGYYWTELVSGTYDLEATAPGYSLETAVVDITTGMTTTQDFNLWRPVITVTPGSFISYTAYISQPVTYTLSISNSGHLATSFEIGELGGSGGVSFEGLNNVGFPIPSPGVSPPDTDGQVGPNHYVQIVNHGTTGSWVGVWDKAGNPLYDFGMGDLWPSGDPCNDHARGDPVVLYDQLADRWLLTQFTDPPSGNYNECIAVSTGPVPSNIASNWYLYTFDVHDTKFNDYPKLGIWPDAYYMMAHQFDTGWAGSGFWAFDRASMLAGTPPQSPSVVDCIASTTYCVYHDLWGDNPNYGGMLPSNLMGSTPPPSGSPNYYIEVDPDWSGSDDIMTIWEVTATFGSGLSVTVVNELTVQDFTRPLDPATTRDQSVHQPGTATRLEALADRLMMHAWYRHFPGEYEVIVTNHTVDATDGSHRAGIRWYEIRKDAGGTDWYIYQDGLYYPDDDHRWVGSIAMDSAGNIALGYSVSSETTYPSIRYAYREAGDAINWMGNETNIISGTGSQTGSNRWGDYSAMSVDPSNDCTFWYTTEYISDTGSVPWRSRIASFDLPGCIDTLEWIGRDPISGTVPASSTVDIDLTVHCTETRDYTGTLFVYHDDPCQINPIEVPLNFHCQEPPLPEPAWEKEVWVNGLLTATYPFAGPITVVPSDTVEIVERVYITHTNDVTFTLAETWTESLVLTNTDSSAGFVNSSPGWAAWYAYGVAPNTWHVLTKTFHVTDTGGLFDTVTETLTVEDADPQLDDRVVTFQHASVCISLTSVTISGTTSGGPGTYTFTTSYSPIGATPPITYLWDNGDTTADSTRSLGIGVHTLTVTATNCSSAQVTDTHTITIECVPLTWVDYDWTPSTPEAGEVVTFSIVSLSPTTATTPITYEWSFGDTYTATGDPVTHTYAVSDVYSAYVGAYNPCSGPIWMSHDIPVTGEPDIGVTPLTLSTALDPDDTVTDPLTITNAATATANLNWSLAENPNVGWLNATPPTGTVAPGNNDSVSVAFDAAGMTPGVYTTVLEITSNDPDEPLVSAPVTLTVNCVEVTSVTLSITNTGTIYTDTVVYFSADIEPNNATTPYTYQVTIDGTPGPISITNDDPVGFNATFATTGTHSVEFGVWNCPMTLPVTDVITFTVREQGVCVELDSVTIDGAISGYPGTYTFTSDYEPFDASIPISYTWDDGGDTDTSVRTLGVGTYTLMVSATNPCTLPPVTDTHQIVITAAPVCTEVTGITLAYTPTGTIYTNTIVHFSADIAPDDADMPYTYTIDYGSGPTLPNIAAVDPYLFTYTFPITGTHAVTFSAWNCAMVVPESDSASVTVSAYGEQDFFIYLPVVLRNY